MKFNYTIINKESNSFGDLIYTVRNDANGETKSLVFGEGFWPDALQLHNAIRHEFGLIIGE